MKMPKFLKPLIISVVIVGIAAGGLYGGYRYNQSKKIAKVAPMSSFAMDGYWGDSIQSYGEVTSEKAQTSYLASGTEILSVNVAEGDHVEEGDVIMTVRKDSQDIDGKKLQIQKASQALRVDQIKLERLQKTEPIPTYMYTQEVYRDYGYTSAVQYKTIDDVTNDGVGGNYKAGELVAEEGFTWDGTSTGFTYYRYEEDSDTQERTKHSVSALSGDLKDADLKDTSLFETTSVQDTYNYLASILYGDAETGKIVGETDYDVEGRVIHGGKAPEGMTPKQLEDAIADANLSIKQKDLNLRKLQNELYVMENTTDNGQVLAQVSGTVSKLQSMQNYNSTQPFFIITATDEYYISGSIGEFYLDSVQIGDMVTISSWETGNTAEAEIISISDTPSKDNNNFYSGSGNENSSNYEFKATFDRNSGIDIGTAVDIAIEPAGQEPGGIYIMSSLIRKDASGNYVMKMNSHNKLEKTYVLVGKSLWGDMTEIKEGLTMDDYLAFPYGNGAIEGLDCEIIDYFEY